MCRQLDTWDQEYDAGKTKKLRGREGSRGGSDLHANGNAFQVRVAVVKEMLLAC